MPYSIAHHGRKWFVKNKDTHELKPKKGYASKAQAVQYLKALEANVADVSKKALGDTPGEVSSTLADTLQVTAEPPPEDHTDRFSFGTYEIVDAGDNAAGEERKFDPEQDRDPNGKWADGGGGSSKTPKPDKTPAAKKPADKPKPAKPADTAPAKPASDYKDFGQYPEFLVASAYQKDAPKPTQSQAEAMEYYRGMEGNYAINKRLRTGEALTGATKAHAKELDSVLDQSKLEHDTTLWRGLSSDNPQWHQFTADIQNGKLTPGSVIKDNGFASTTLDGGIAQQKFGDGGVVFKIKAPKGSNGLYMNTSMDKYTGGNYQHEYRDEKEVLLPRGSQFRVDNIKKGKNGYEVEVTLNGHSAAALSQPVTRSIDAVARLELPAKRNSDCEFIPVRSAAQPEELEGYLALWGSPDQRDCYNTYFDRQNPPMMDLDFLPIPLRYAHGQDPEVGKEAIGKIVQVWLDERGIKFRALLDQVRPFYQRIVREIRQGILGTSSGTAEYLAEFADDGRFVSWPIAEVSLTDKPCEYRMPAVAAVRSLPDNQHIQLEVKPLAKAQAITKGDPRDCGCDAQPDHADAPARINQPVRTTMKRTANRATTPVMPTKPGDGADGDVAEKRGLNIGHLGLDANASIEDVYQALCEFLGDDAANAIMEAAMGPGAEADEADEVNPAESLMDEREDPEDDTRPEEFTGNEDLEDLQEGKPDGSAAKRAANLQTILRKALATQQQATKPRSVKQPRYDELAELRTQNRMLKQLLTNAPAATKPTPKTDRREQPRQPQISVRDLLYDTASAADLAHAVQLIQSVGKRPSDALLRATSFKIANEIEKGTPVGSDMTVRYLTPFRSTADVMGSEPASIRAAYRANEVMGDANTNFGSNYIGVFYDTSLWLKVRAMPIWRELEARGMEEKVIPVGYASDVIPLEGADFSWYRVPETLDIDSTGRPKINITPGKAGTSATTLTVRTMGALVYYSVLMEEDSIVPMAAELNRKANIEVQEQIEYILFNGDTATGTGNLNFKNGTVNASDVYNYTVLDGMLKAAIIANSGAAARQSGALSDLDYQLLFGLLGKANNYITGSDPTKLMFVVDPATGLATDRLPIVKTKDINSAATVEAGHMKEMYAVPVYRSGQISLADSTGYIDSVTAANNKFGRILLVRPDQWVVGFKRQVTLEYFRDAPGQSNGMVITLRLGLQTRDNTQAAAASYNVTVS